ncbi:MAG: tRNA lysidine(34) synthetase TilS, partial [Lysobacter sp.]|nr:tRNA lysidine(34) synthetase TilS [Lysobacter sp.]
MRQANAPLTWRPRPAIAASAPVVVGFSGGLDSTVLLHRLAADPAMRAHGLRAVHIDHGLHPDATRWAEHARTVCAALGIECRTITVAVPRESGLGPEASARRARRAAFAEALAAGEVLALAQHRDDQAETFLLRALRASGPDGLAAMRPWRAFASGWMWRPLLDVPRSDLLAYAEREGLQWIEDPSNRDESIDRNWLRHRVLPLLRERWPQADVALARAAALSAEASDLLIEGDDAALTQARAGRHGEALSRRAL